MDPPLVMEEVKTTSPSSSFLRRTEKPVVVRVKRKASQASLNAFWLEINERPHKRSILDFENLSISDQYSEEALKTKRLLVQHVETMGHSDTIEDVLQCLLPTTGGSKDIISKIELRKRHFKQGKKRDQLQSVTRQEREEFVKNARFEQIWKSRRGESDPLRELCHLYDVVRVDIENEKSVKELQHVSIEDNAILCNYLPLLREYIPSAAQEIESEIKAYASGEGSSSDSSVEVPKEDCYVYDLYTVEDYTGNEEDILCDYPLVQVKEDDGFDGVCDSEYDSEDSNAEDNPRNDYPDEESSNEEEEEVDPFGDFECPNSENEEELRSCNKDKEEESSEGKGFSDSECSDDEDEDNLRWGYR